MKCQLTAYAVVCLLLVATSVQAGIITGATRNNGCPDSPGDPGIVPGPSPQGLQVGSQAFMDRWDPENRYYWWKIIPPELVGADYVKTYCDDKKETAINVSYTVTLSQAARVYIFVDYRYILEEGAFPWLTDGSAGAIFTDTGLSITLFEGGPNGYNVDREFKVYGASVPAGTYTLGPAYRGYTSRNFYSAAAVGATIRMEPETLNLGSKGVFTAFVDLPEGFDEEDIDVSTAECEGALVQQGVMADDGKMVFKFDRADLIGVSAGNAVEMIVTMKLFDGTSFIGSDFIRVIGPGGGVQAAAEDAAAIICPGLGRTVTILLTLSEPGQDGGPGPADCRATLLDNSVRWAGKEVPGMRVLVIRDDNQSGEWTEDTDAIYNTLVGLGYDVSRLSEPEGGLAYEEIEGYDVVLLSNPGWPVDDLLTVQSLQRFYNEGGGVILQGDDMTYSDDPAVRGVLQTLSGLEFIDNGVWYFDHFTDGMAGDFYTVTITGDHPVTAGLEGVSFGYGDDIDASRPVYAMSLAHAAIEEHESKPAIAVRETAATIGGLINGKEQCFANGWIDNQGVAQSLDQKLNAAKAALDRNQSRTAVNILHAFLNELEAQSGKHVSPRCAYLLAVYAEQLIALLS